MRNVRLTCINHTNLRWMCKSIEVNNLGQHNGARNIFYLGKYNPTNEMWCDETWIECECPPSDLRFAPEEIERQKTEPLTD
jgi:hypothetical protein